MKTSYLKLFVMLLFVASLGFSTKLVAQNDSTDVKTATSKQMPAKGKYTGPMPAPSVYSHNGSIVPVGTYVAIGKYFNVTKDELLMDSDVIDFIYPGGAEFSYQEVWAAFRTGIIKGVDVRLITSTFTKSMDRFKLDGTKFTDTNNGLGDFKLVGRYGIFNQKTGPANVIVGAGVTIPVGTTDAVDSNGNLLPGGMQLGSGSWNPMFEFGAHKVSKQHWNSVHFLYVMSMKGELGPHEFTRSQVLKYNYAYNYALNNKFDVGAELNGEIKSMGVLNGVDLATSGGHAIYFAPEVHYKFSKKAYMGICAPIPVYENLNGPQLGGGLMIVANVVVKF